MDDHTDIENTANIFFDLNPPIVTNTTRNTMVTSFDSDEDDFLIWEDCNDENPAVNPNAIDIPNNGIDEDCDEEDTIVSNDEITLAKPRIFPNPTNGWLSILFHSSTKAFINIKDYTGKSIFEEKLENKTDLNMADFPQGVYLLIITADKGIWVERVVKI